MWHLRLIRQSMILFGSLFLLTASGSSLAEPAALGEGDAPPSESKPAEPPKEKRAITVPAGTVMMIKTENEISSNDKPGRRFSATLEANLLAGDEVVAKAGSQVYGEVKKSTDVGRGVVVHQSGLVLGLTQINIEGTLYPIQTGNFSEKSTGVLLKGRRAVTVAAGSILEFALTQPLTVGK
jgi:hypothetical protein